MELEIAFYRKHFSLLQVMNHFKLLKTQKDKEIFIKAVLIRDQNIFYIPNEMKGYLKKKIVAEFPQYKDFFLLLLDKGLKQTSKNKDKQQKRCNNNFSFTT